MFERHSTNAPAALERDPHAEGIQSLVLGTSPAGSELHDALVQAGVHVHAKPSNEGAETESRAIDWERVGFPKGFLKKGAVTLEKLLSEVPPSESETPPLTIDGPFDDAIRVLYHDSTRVLVNDADVSVKKELGERIKEGRLSLGASEWLAIIGEEAFQLPSLESDVQMNEALVERLLTRLRVRGAHAHAFVRHSVDAFFKILKKADPAFSLRTTADERMRGVESMRGAYRSQCLAEALKRLDVFPEFQEVLAFSLTHPKQSASFPDLLEEHPFHSEHAATQQAFSSWNRVCLAIRAFRQSSQNSEKERLSREDFTEHYQALVSSLEAFVDAWRSLPQTERHRVQRTLLKHASL